MTELSKTEKIYECISKISGRIEDMSTLVISPPSILSATGQIWKSRQPAVVVTQNSTVLLYNLQKIDLYILTFYTVQELSHWFKGVYLSEFWNPNGKFIISILQQDNITEIFEITWRYYIININLVSFNNNLDIGVYTYYPYKSGYCSNISPELQFNCSGNIPKDLYPKKVPYNFKGCPMRILACPFYPYVIDYLANPKDPTKSGYELTIMDTILTKLNITQNILKHNYTSWGVKLPNGTYTLMYGELQKMKADLVLGLAFLQYNATDFELLTQAIIDNIIWWVPATSLRDPWVNLIYVYTPFLWGLVVLSIIINGVIWWIFGRNNEQVSIYNNLFTSIIASMLVFLQGSLQGPNSNPLRILFGFWLMFCVILYTTHQSQLVSALTKPKYEKEITSLEEMVDSGIKFGFYAPGIQFFQDPNNRYHTIVRTTFVSCPVNEACMNRTAFQRDFAVCKSRRQLLYLIPKLYVFPDGRPRLYGFGDGFLAYARYVLRKGNPVIKRMNKILDLLFANGLINKWQLDVTFVKKFPDNPSLTTLTIEHLALGFLYLFVGLTLSTVVFIVEMISLHRKRKRFFLRSAPDAIAPLTP